MAKRMVDEIAQRVFIEVTQSAANTLTFQQIRWAVGTFQGIGLMLERVEWYPQGAVISAELATSGDAAIFGITLRDDLDDLDPSNQSIVALNRMDVAEAGTPTNIQVISTPLVNDFSALSGGGLLLPPNPMFIAFASAGFASARTLRAVLYYRFRQLSDQESIEMLQTILPGNV